MTFGKTLSLNLSGKNSITSQINQGTTDENQNSKVNTINKLLDSGASASIVHKDTLDKFHKIPKDKENKWPTIAGILFLCYFHKGAKIKTSGIKPHRRKLHQMSFEQ